MTTKGMTGWALAAMGDGSAQAIQCCSARQHGEEPAVDLRRLFAFSVHNGLWTAFGLHPILNAVDRLFPGVSIRAVASKTVLQLAVMDPLLYLPSVYVGNGLLLGQDVAQVRAKVAAEYWPTTIWMWKFWSPVTVVQFRFVPIRHQANFINMCDSVWLVLLSLLYNPAAPKPK